MRFELEKVLNEVKLLSDVDDSFSYEVSIDKALFIQVVDYGEGLEYLIELNVIKDDGEFEPCATYNASATFGDMTAFVSEAISYLINTNDDVNDSVLVVRTNRGIIGVNEVLCSEKEALANEYSFAYTAHGLDFYSKPKDETGYRFTFALLKQCNN